VSKVADLAISAVAPHPSITRVELAGSRSRGDHEDLSDWDLAVTTADFGSVARDLPVLVKPLGPLAALWEPLGHFPVYTVILRGPTIVEYLFLDHSQEPQPPVMPSRETLSAIDTHFWQWLWWLATKASIGRDDLLEQHWPVMYGHLLAPVGADTVPDAIEGAISAFVVRRRALEREYAVAVPRALEREVRRGIRRLGFEA
jgi:hypothetical protein